MATIPADQGRLRIARVLWPVVVAFLVVTASGRSRVASPEITSIDDKFAHFAVFGLIATLICRVGHGWRAAVWALVIASAFGATDEWHQSFVPGRRSDIRDWIADTSGAACAVALYAGWPRYRRLLETQVWPLGRRRSAR